MNEREAMSFSDYIWYSSKVYLVLVGENLSFFLFSLPSTVQLISSILHFTGETIILILFGLSTAQRILLRVLISLNI